VEENILDLLKAGPKRLTEIAAATEAKQSTTSERMRRMCQRSLVAPVGGGAWAASV
jgi:DNA-binding IclR family transcriptional regulator